MENENNASRKNNTSQDAATHFRENPTMPVRVLVSTATHLVPGRNYFARIEFIQNLISQHHWNQDFERHRDRFESYNAEFGYDNRACHFLVDHGESADGNDAAVPVLWYRWTGESLVPVHDALPSQIRRKLKKVPFTRPKPASRTKPRELSATERREDIRAKFRCDMGISEEDFIFLKENSEHAKWLEKNIEPRFWSKFEALGDEYHGEIISVRKLTHEEAEEVRAKLCTKMWDCKCPWCR